MTARPPASGWRAEKALWRARTETHGAPGALVDALLDESFTLWAVPGAGGGRFLRGLDEPAPAGGVRLRAQGQPLSLTADDCARYGLARPVADAAEASRLLGLPGSLETEPGYRALIDWSSLQARAVAADRERADRLADEAARLAEAATAEPKDVAALRQSVSRRRPRPGVARRGLHHRPPRPADRPRPAGPPQAAHRLRDWLGGVKAAYERLKGSTAALPPQPGATPRPRSREAA